MPNKKAPVKRPPKDTKVPPFDKLKAGSKAVARMKGDEKKLKARR